jgi:hypothetical protein
VSSKLAAAWRRKSLRSRRAIAAASIRSRNQASRGIIDASAVHLAIQSSLIEKFARLGDG